MKDTQFNKIIAGKDLSKPEDVKAIFDGINEIENAWDAKNQDSIKKLQDENKALKAETDKIKDLSTQLSEKDNKINFLNNKNYVYKNINHNLDDKAVDELMYLVDYRLKQNPKSKFEDVVKNVSEERGFLNKAAALQEVHDTEVEERTEQVTEQPTPAGVRYKGSPSEPLPEEDNSPKGQMSNFKSLIKGRQK